MHITNGSGTGGDGPAITIDLNPTVPKTVGDALLEPAVIGVVVVVRQPHAGVPRPPPLAARRVPPGGSRAGGRTVPARRIIGHRRHGYRLSPS